MNDMQQYRRCNESVSNGIKYEIPAAVKEPSQFIMEFLRSDKEFIDETLLNIFNTLLEKFKTNDEPKKAKYIKKTKMTEENYAELTKENLGQEFNQDDYLKNAWLQYMLHAYQIKLDNDS